MGIFDVARAIIDFSSKRVDDKKRKEGSEAFKKTLNNLLLFPVQRGGKFHGRNFAKRDLGEIKCKSLSKSTALSKLNTFIAFDVETTGIGLSGNEVIEISAIRFDNFEPVSIFTTLIKPRHEIPLEATKVNHITNEMVENAPAFYEIIPSLETFLGDYPIVAHNAPFDVSHLYADGLDSMSKKTVYDTCDISRKMCKKIPDHKLSTVCANYGIYFEGAHRAAADTLACGLLFVRLIMEKYECKTIEELKQKI